MSKGINRFLSSSELDNDMNGLTIQGENVIRNICTDLINGGGGGVSVVQSVNNVGPISGNVTLTSLNITENTNLYHTPQRVWDTLNSTATSLGDLIFRSAVNFRRLGMGTAGQVLAVKNVGTDLYEWITPSTGTVQSVNSVTPDGNGNILIKTGDISETVGTNLYFTTQRVTDHINTLDMDSFDDVNYSNPLADKQILKYDTLFGEWRNSLPLLTDNDDVNITNPSNGQVLTFQNGDWINQNAQTATFSALGDVATDCNFQTTINTHDLIFRDSGKWTTGTYSLFWLSNTSQANALTNGDLLTYNSTSQKWENIQPTAASTTLSALTDCTITTPTTGQLLQYTANGKWENKTVTTTGTLAGLTDVNLGTLSDYQYLYWDDGTDKWVNGSVFGLDKASRDVEYDSAQSVGQTLVWTTVSSVSRWRPRFITHSNLGDTTLTNIQNDDILIYDSTATKFINSQRFKTIETNYNTNISNILASQMLTNITSPTAYTTNYVQLDNPIVRSTFTTFAPIVPLDNGNDATGNVNFLNFPGNPAGLVSGFYNPWNQVARANFFKLTGWGVYDTLARTTGATGDWVQNPGFMNVNYSQNNLTANTVYRLYHITGNDNGAQTMRVWGLKTLAMVAAQMTVNAQPVVGADWDHIGDVVCPSVNTNSIQFTAANNYFLLRFGNITGGWHFSSGYSLFTGTATPSTMTLQIPADMSLTNSSGNLVLTNLNTNKTDESWKLNINNLVTYYLMNTVNKICRGVNSLFLNNTQISDSWIRANNGTSNYIIQNSTGTQSWLTTSNTGIIVPNNRSSNIFYYTGTSFTTTIVALATWYEIVPPAAPTVTNFGTSLISFIGGLRTIFAVAGTYRISVTIVNNMADPNEVTFRISKNGNTGTPTTWYDGSVMICFSDSKYQTCTTTFISQCAANDYISIYAQKISGGTNKILSIMSYTIAISNMLNS